MLVSYSGVGYFILFGGSRLLGYKYVECVCVCALCNNVFLFLFYFMLSVFI